MDVQKDSTGCGAVALINEGNYAGLSDFKIHLGYSLG